MIQLKRFKRVNTIGSWSSILRGILGSSFDEIHVCALDNFMYILYVLYFILLLSTINP